MGLLEVILIGTGLTWVNQVQVVAAKQVLLLQLCELVRVAMLYYVFWDPS